MSKIEVCVRLNLTFVPFQVADQTELISTLEEELSQKKLSREKLLANIDRYGAEKVELFEVESSLTRDRENIGRTCEQLKLERGQLIRETINLSQKVNSLVESQANAENRLARSQGMKNVIAGVKSVEKILQYLVSNCSYPVGGRTGLADESILY